MVTGNASKLKIMQLDSNRLTCCAAAVRGHRVGGWIVA